MNLKFPLDLLKLAQIQLVKFLLCKFTKKPLPQKNDQFVSKISHRANPTRISSTTKNNCTEL